jgi:hypothetical protein
MKQPEDNKTLDLVGNLPKRRGRPASGSALSNADRQRKYREKLAAEGRQVISLDLPVECVEALRKHVQFKDMTLGDAVEKIVRDRLLRKR